MNRVHASASKLMQAIAADATTPIIRLFLNDLLQPCVRSGRSLPALGRIDRALDRVK
jgi:hypothetical protein